MDRVVCPTCGKEHDLSEMEPSYRWPDAYLAVPIDERARRTMARKDDCRIRDNNGAKPQFFLRVLLPVPVLGDSEPCSWGVWVEVDETAFARASELWDDPAQERESPFVGRLANSVKGYDDTLGLPGTVQLTGPTSVPTFTLETSVQHARSRAARRGLSGACVRVARSTLPRLIAHLRANRPLQQTKPRSILSALRYRVRGFAAER